MAKIDDYRSCTDDKKSLERRISLFEKAIEREKHDLGYVSMHTQAAYEKSIAMYNSFDPDFRKTY